MEGRTKIPLCPAWQNPTRVAGTTVPAGISVLVALRNSRFHTDFQAHSTSAALDHQSLFPNLMPSFHSGLLSCQSCSHRDSKPFYTAPLHLHSSATEQNGSWAVIKFLGIAGRCNVLIKKVIAPPLFLQVWLITWRFHSSVLTPSKGSPHHLLIFN